MEEEEGQGEEEAVAPGESLQWPVPLGLVEARPVAMAVVIFCVGWFTHCPHEEADLVQRRRRAEDSTCWGLREKMRPQWTGQHRLGLGRSLGSMLRDCGLYGGGGKGEAAERF